MKVGRPLSGRHRDGFNVDLLIITPLGAEFLDARALWLDRDDACAEGSEHGDASANVRADVKHEIATCNEFSVETLDPPRPDAVTQVRVDAHQPGYRWSVTALPRPYVRSLS